MVSYIDASAVVSTGVALVMFQHAFRLGSLQIGYLSSSLGLLVALGALLGGWLSDNYGRRRVFNLTLLGLVLGCTVMALAQGFGVLLAGVILLGFFVGASLPASLALVGEFAPPGARGRMLTFSQVLWNVGILVTQLIIALVSDIGVAGGRLLFVHLIVMSVLVAAMHWRLPESPVWAAGHAGPRPGGASQLGFSQFAELTSKPYLALFAGLAAFYGLAQVAASIKAQFLGFMFVNVAGSTLRLYSAAYMSVMVVGLIAMMLFMRVVDGRNRLGWFVSGGLAFIASFAVPAVLGVTVPSLFVSSLLSGFGGALAFEGIMKVWAQEFFPASLLGTAQGSVIAFGRILAALMAIWAPTLLMLNARGFFAFLTGVMALAMAIGLCLALHSERSRRSARG
ncbi:MAG TPA: MFS transporter [Novosphingobium sp.]|nr:MFS transporter [Novosphingobium sp.]